MKLTRIALAVAAAFAPQPATPSIPQFSFRFLEPTRVAPERSGPFLIVRRKHLRRLH